MSSDNMSAIEYENMEQKYIETKSRLKKTLQYNERYTIQIQKLTKRLKRLENENKQLEDQLNQLQATTRDTSESDVSTPTNLHQERASMVDLVHSKNQQISDLLKDIEEVENENLVLKDKLAEAKDQLATAVNEIATITETIKLDEMRLQERDGTIKNMTTEIKDLKEELDLAKKVKCTLEEQVKLLSSELKEKESEWKAIIEEKEKALEELNLRLRQAATKTTPTNLKKDEGPEKESGKQEVDKLKTTLSETEARLYELKSEMETCTVELKESAKLIKKLTIENRQLKTKIEETKESQNDMKEQLKKAHDRCQNLQREVEYANKMTKLFEDDLSNLKEKLKENGNSDTVANLEEIQQLKIEKLLHEKQIVGLVKDINKLQEMCNIFEIENASMRHQLGLSLQDAIDIGSSVLSESKKQKRLIEKLQSENRRLQEEKVKFKLEIKSLKQQLTALLTHSNIENNKLRSNEIPPSKPKDDRSTDIKALSEENAALRKGLHEILNSIQIRNETSPREIKSDILERLLRALDVKHVSGWYHPAMRLQAELHTLEGVNSELREQLHEARMELDQLKSTNATPRGDRGNVVDQEVKNIEDALGEKRESFLANALSSDIANLESIRLNVMKIFACLNETEENVESKLENEFEYLKHHLDLLHENCNSEKEKLLENLKSIEDNILELESPEINSKMTTESLIEQITIERKKANYTFKQMTKMQEEIAILKRQSNVSCKNHLLEIETLLKTITALSSKLNSKEKQSVYAVTPEAYKEMQNILNENVKKYRQLLSEDEERQKEHTFELNVFAQKEVDLVKENSELKDKLNKVLVKLNQDIYKQDDNVLPISQKLANAEVQALSEKHRADHTNNLYELVKEQLKKSEDKFVEFSKYGDGLLQKNLALQERVAELEDQLTLCVEPELFKELQGNLNKIIKENEKLCKENEELTKKHQKLSDAQQQSSSWTNEKEQELLGLKHEIIDLTTLSDDKLVIDQLYCEQIKLRFELRECQMQVEFLKREVSIWESRYVKLSCEMEEQRNFCDVERRAFAKKMGFLQDIVIKQRIQYHGCVPMVIQEVLVEKLQSISKDRHEVFISLLNVKALEKELENTQKMGNSKRLAKLIAFIQQKEDIYDPKNHQIEYLKNKIENQEKDIEKLERELFSAYQLANSKPQEYITKNKAPVLVKELVYHESIDPVEISVGNSPKSNSKLTIFRNVESQTEQQQIEEKEDPQLTIARIQLKNLQNQLCVKENLVAERESSIEIMEKLAADKDKQLIDIKEQLKDKECHIARLESSLRNIEERRKPQVQAPHHDGAAGDGADLRSSYLDEQIMALKVTLKTAQDRLKQKDVEIIKYQTLLKDDRDKHSLAAANLQKELLALRKTVISEQEDIKRLQKELTISRQKSVAVEKYVSQVRALEKHLAELHTQLAQLQAQLQNSHQEAARWRQLAQDRLLAMQELGKSLNEQHNKELSNYKTDYEKLKELSEEEQGKKAGPEYKGVGHVDPDILKLCREKDDKILELTSKLKQIESGETLKTSETVLTTEKPGLVREHEILRGKYENLVSREKSLKDEIKDLKEQLSKRSNLSARSQRSERTMKEQMQKRITSLEKEINELNDKLAQQQLINEKHKLTAHEDYEKWKKQKYWQENCEKYKNKLQQKEEEVQKLQQTCIGYKMLIERLEREKINLENRIKNLKSDQRNLISDHEKALLKEENTKLARELTTLQAKMEMRQQGSGALGAALMQEKLEAQERKIAVLELSAKGNVEVRNELERLQASMSNLQKKNLCLEAENLELKMDLEKYSTETPHLQEQIQHLESYIEILKEENQKQATSTDSITHIAETTEDKKVPQLERTVFILKRVVEKLQVENKRLLSGKRPFPERSASADKLRRDFVRLKEQHTECLQKIKELEFQLQTAKKAQKQPGFQRTDQLRSELAEVKEQLLQKTQLLDKVKALLHTAAAREKQLLKEVAELKNAANTEEDHHIDIPSPIEEVSEISSET